MLIPFLVFAACTPVMMARQRENLDRGHLGEAVEMYWKAARWGDVKTLSALLVNPADQLAVARVLAAPTLRVTDVRVLQVVVGPELIERRERNRADLDQRWREGTALVHVEVYGVATDRVESATEEQKWVMDVRGWHVDTVASPIDADRPW